MKHITGGSHVTTATLNQSAIHLYHTAAILSRRLKMLCFSTSSLAAIKMGARLGVVKQSCFSLWGQYGCRVIKANNKVLSRNGKSRLTSVKWQSFSYLLQKLQATTTKKDIF